MTITIAEKLFIFKGFNQSLLNNVFDYNTLKLLLEHKGIVIDEKNSFQIIENTNEPITKFIHISHIIDPYMPCQNIGFEMKN